MSRTVSARIPKELHEDLRERCNEIGESINDFVKASIEFALYQSSDFDFGEPEEWWIKSLYSDIKHGYGHLGFG